MRLKELIRNGVDPRLLHWANCPQGKGGGSPPPPPPPPDPANQITAQAKALPSIFGPQGSQVYSGDPNVAGSFTRTDSLSPEAQRQFDAKNRIAESLLSRTEGAIPQLPAAPYSFRGATDPTTNAFFQNQKKLLDTAFDRDEVRERQRLTNQGIPEGSQAFKEAMDDFTRRKSSAYESAAANALQTGFSQDITTRQQNLNEIAQALGGAQLAPIGGGGGSPVDVASAFANQAAGQNRAYQGQLAGYNAGVAADNSTTGGLFSLGSAALMAF
jgi:hypothetical protein